MSETNVEDLGLDEILDDPADTTDLETEVVENEAGEVMFDPNRVVSDEEAAATLAAASEPAVGEVVQERVDPDNPPEPDISNMTAAQRREYRRQRIRERNAAK